MLHASTSATPKSIGPGIGGVTDKILHGSDGKHVLGRTLSPPSLQDVVFWSLIQQNVCITLVDNTLLRGKLLWYKSGKFGIRPDGFNQIVMSCNRVMHLDPSEMVEDSVHYVTESVRATMLHQEERASKLQIVKRRLQERNNRQANIKHSQSRQVSQPP